MADDLKAESLETHAERVALEARAYRAALRWIVHAPDRGGVAAAATTRARCSSPRPTSRRRSFEELVHASERRLGVTVGATPITRLSDAARGAP